MSPRRSGAWGLARRGSCGVGAAQGGPGGPGAAAGPVPPPEGARTPPAKPPGLRTGPERRVPPARLLRSARPGPGRPPPPPPNGTSVVSPAGNDTSPESFLLHNALARKPKRIRTAFSPSQLLRLEHAFEKNHYVVGAERKQLAHSLSLTETQVSGARARRPPPRSLDPRSRRPSAELRAGLRQRAQALAPRPPPSGCGSFQVPGFLGLQKGPQESTCPRLWGGRGGRPGSLLRSAGLSSWLTQAHFW